MVVRKEASYISIATAIGLLTSAALGGMYVGALAQDVDTLKEDKPKIEKIEDSVNQIKIEQSAAKVQMQHVLKEQTKQDKKLDKIIEKLEELD